MNPKIDPIKINEASLADELRNIAKSIKPEAEKDLQHLKKIHQGIDTFRQYELRRLNRRSREDQRPIALMNRRLANTPKIVEYFKTAANINPFQEISHAATKPGAKE